MEYTTGEILSIIGTLLLMVAVFVGAYFVTKLVGKKYSIPGAGGSKRVSVLESTPVGKDSAVVVVKAGEKILLIGVTPRSMSFLSELDRESFPDAPAQDKDRPSFMSVLRSTVTGKKGSSGEGEDS